MPRLPARVFDTAYGLCAALAFVVLLGVTTMLAVLLPRLDWRRDATRALARAGLVVLRVRSSCAGLENLPESSCVVVANHSSYLDGVVLTALLPPRFTFVIKHEAGRAPVLGFLLSRLGSVFIDRDSSHGRHRGARNVVQRAEVGQSLVFFPEGTFDDAPGLKRFHLGAFAAAARSGMPVVPAVIHGARRALPSHTIIVRPGRIRVEFLAPIEAPDAARAAHEMRREARRRILSKLDEPDLAEDPAAG